MRNTYRKDIVLVILLKIVGLFLLWEICFSNPLSLRTGAFPAKQSPAIATDAAIAGRSLVQKARSG